jgi:hypothetical protein
MNLRRLWPITLLALILTSAAAAPANAVVEIRLRGRFFTEPATVRLTVAVEPASENRALVVQADGERLFRSSEVPLEGERDQRLHTVEFKNLPAGAYTLRAEVHSSADVRGIAEAHVIVGDPER